MGKIYLKLGVFDDARLQSSLSLRGKKGHSFCNFFDKHFNKLFLI